jgi:hypothetical protein
VLAADLARGQPLSDVSSTAPGSSPSRAVDGNGATWWTSGTGGTQWLAADLGATAAIGRVVVRWGPAQATAYWLETSNDLVTWTRVWPTGPDASGDQTANLAVSGRHVAVVARAGVDPGRYDLASLEVYGPAP